MTNIPVMKLLRLTQAFILILTINSCAQSGEKDKINQIQNSFEHNGKTYTLKKGVDLSTVKPTKKEQSKIIFHTIRDQQRNNMVLGYLPMPKDWELKDKSNKDGAYIFGPNGVHVYLPRNNAFSYSQLFGYNQMVAESGGQIKPLKSPEQLVKEELVPAFAKDGVQLVRQYHIPELQKYDKEFDQFIFKSIPIRKEFKVLATEWEDKKGNSLLFVIRHYAAYTQENCNWGYLVNMMDAKTSHFKNAKKNYLYSLINTKYNPKWRQVRYMEDAKLSAESQKLHEGRMIGLKAEYQAILKSGKEHSDMVDRNHKKFMDTHLERQTVSASGTSYQVDAGSRVYWINANGEYIPSDNVNFDPNNDPNLNSQTWTKTKKNN